MTRQALLDQIAYIISDYRAGEIPQRNSEHVNQWISQFPDSVQEPILKEMAHVLQRTYFTRAQVNDFMSNLASSKKIAGDNPCSYWQGVNFLNIQEAGNSQRDLLAIFNSVLVDTCSFGVNDCGSSANKFVYIDDVMFTGSRIRRDVTDWISNAAPTGAELDIILIGFHRGGRYYADTGISEKIKETAKDIQIKWWRLKAIEDRKKCINCSDVLRPTGLPNDVGVQAYAANLRYAPVYREAGNVGGNAFFSSDNNRQLLEQEFLKAGVRIREMCPHLGIYQRPLGNMVLETLGFGSLIVTFRNCPNNAPLALWAGDPWRPLFPRKTN